MDSRSSSLSRGMRNHSPTPEGEEMPEVLSGSCHGEGEGPISRAKREGGLRRVRESPGFPGGKALQGPSGSGDGVRQEVEGEEAAEGSEVRQLRDLRRSAPTEWECQVLSALLGGSEWSMASPATFCSEKGERTLRGMREGSSKGGSGLLRRMLDEEYRCYQANLQRTEEGRTMHAMREGPEGKDSEMRGMSVGQEKEGVSSGDSEGWVKATIPEGEHPFDYLFEGHQFLMAGCLLLEEIEMLEEEELEQIRKLLDPYAERIGEFYERIHRAPEEEK